MTQIALHANQASIADDMEFYLTDRWDKHNQITPKDDIVNLTLDSENLIFGRGQVSNFLYPIPRNSVEAIYIGPSLKLYSNQWGCAFLSQLLRLLEPEGKIILRVYPEGRAHERGYWCRSALETTFRNRSGINRVSNIRAENDGVMSMRVGRTWPPRFPSTIDWFFRERASLLLNQVVCGELSPEQVGSAFSQYAQAFWAISAQSAVIERIFQDRFGAKAKGKRFLHIGAENSLLTAEMAVNERLRLTSATVVLPDAEKKDNCSALALDLAHDIPGQYRIRDGASESIGNQKFDIVVLINEPDVVPDTDMIRKSFELTASGGSLVWQDDWRHESANDALAVLRGERRYYQVDATVEIKGEPRERAYCVVTKP